MRTFSYCIHCNRIHSGDLKYCPDCGCTTEHPDTSNPDGTWQVLCPRNEECELGEVGVFPGNIETLAFQLGAALNDTLVFVKLSDKEIAPPKRCRGVEVCVDDCEEPALLFRNSRISSSRPFGGRLRLYLTK